GLPRIVHHPSDVVVRVGSPATLPPSSGSEMANLLTRTRWMRIHSLSFYQKEVCSSSASPMKRYMPA
ncbi:hypothetical protein M9458_022113, partial [Cirrhinus mrigala]